MKVRNWINVTRTLNVGFERLVEKLTNFSVHVNFQVKEQADQYYLNLMYKFLEPKKIVICDMLNVL